MLMRPNKAEKSVHGCHCPGDMAVLMRKVLTRPWVGVECVTCFYCWRIMGDYTYACGRLYGIHSVTQN